MVSLRKFHKNQYLLPHNIQLAFSQDGSSKIQGHNSYFYLYHSLSREHAYEFRKFPLSESNLHKNHIVNIHYMFDKLEQHPPLSIFHKDSGLILNHYQYLLSLHNLKLIAQSSQTIEHYVQNYLFLLKKMSLNKKDI